MKSFASARFGRKGIMNLRTDRINEEIAKAISEILPTIKDPRVQKSGMLTITHVDTSGDLSQAKVYISVFYNKDADQAHVKKELKAGLKSSSGYIRKCLGTAIKLRSLPELFFILDDSLDRGARIIKLINDTIEEE